LSAEDAVALLLVAAAGAAGVFCGAVGWACCGGLCGAFCCALCCTHPSAGKGGHRPARPRTITRITTRFICGPRFSGFRRWRTISLPRTGLEQGHNSQPKGRTHCQLLSKSTQQRPTTALTCCAASLPSLLKESFRSSLSRGAIVQSSFHLHLDLSQADESSRASSLRVKND